MIFYYHYESEIIDDNVSMYVDGGSVVSTYTSVPVGVGHNSNGGFARGTFGTQRNCGHEGNN